MCPFCQYPKSAVTTTETYDTFIRRRRKCKNCGGEFYGHEVYGGIIKPPPGQDYPLRKLSDANNGK